jgi:hypothetical protein
MVARLFMAMSAPQWLDCTVIDPAVNRACRLLKLAKRLDRQVMVSNAFSQEADQTLTEKALAALRAFDAGVHGSDGQDRRRTVLDEAADRVWAFMI